MSSTTFRFIPDTRDAPNGTIRLLAAGLAAGPVFAITWFVQGMVRDGYDFTRHPMSLLALGHGGWVQIGNFLVTGSLVLACAAGMRRALAGRVGSRWAPRLVSIMGIGLIASGVFTADAGAGFPAGAPEGVPIYSWHGILHEVGHLVVVLAWTSACFVLRKRFAAEGLRGWAHASVAIVPAVFAMIAIPHLDSFPVRIALASVAQLAFIGLAAWRLRR
jgi:hypothetical protein